MTRTDAPGLESEVRCIAIIGCGLIGASWATLCLAHGYAVTAWDPSAEIRRTFRERLSLPLAQLKELTPGLKTSTDGLTICETLTKAVRNADLVQENAPEKTALKRALYAEIIAAAPPHAIISSSTSSLTWSELSEGLPDGSRLITANPFNPPHLMPLVELFASDATVRARAEQFYKALGREVVVLERDAVGHIANRLASALWREAVNIVAEGIADVSAVDRALVNGPGLRWSVVGAHMGYHLGGGDGGATIFSISVRARKTAGRPSAIRPLPRKFAGVLSTVSWRRPRARTSRSLKQSATPASCPS